MLCRCRRSYAQDVATYAGQHGIELAASQKFFGSIAESVESAVQNVKNSLARIIVCITSEVDMEQIVFSAARKGILQKGYVWITADGIASPTDVAMNSNNPPEMARLLTGFLRISVNPFVGHVGERFQSVWRNEPVENKMDAEGLLSTDETVYDKDCDECPVSTSLQR